MSAWKLPNVADRIISRAPKRPDGCLVWSGSIDWSGYARIYYNGRNWKASRLIWFSAHGEIPNRSFVLHRCDERRCVNIDHLFLGTNADNMADMVRKRRSPRSKAKLTPQQVASIRAAVGSSNVRLAKDYGVSDATICQIRKWNTWRHL